MIYIYIHYTVFIIIQIKYHRTIHNIFINLFQAYKNSCPSRGLHQETNTHSKVIIQYISTSRLGCTEYMWVYAHFIHHKYVTVYFCALGL